MVTLPNLARLVASAVHAVVAEYRKLDQVPPPAAPARQELSCTQARVESSWQPTHQAPARARAAGFGKPAG